MAELSWKSVIQAFLVGSLDQQGHRALAQAANVRTVLYSSIVLMTAVATKVADPMIWASGFIWASTIINVIVTNHILIFKKNLNYEFDKLDFLREAIKKEVKTPKAISELITAIGIPPSLAGEASNQFPAPAPQPTPIMEPLPEPVAAPQPSIPDANPAARPKKSISRRKVKPIDPGERS